MKKITISPTAPAAIMALGIFLIGSIEVFPSIDRFIGTALAGLLLLIWIYMYGSLFNQMMHTQFRNDLFNDPIGFFAIGTWIAAVSVLTNVLLKYFPSLQFIIYASAFINIFFWAIFVCLAFINLWKLSKAKKVKIHGLILLAAVATQSTVIMSKALFPHLPAWICICWICTGLLLYGAGCVLLFRMYALNSDWNLAADWKNTNCIIHGALSISGVAIAVSNAFPANAVIVCWSVAFLLLLLVETIEIIRAYKRIRSFGYKQALLVFDTSQWARNFTFGMFFVLSKHALVNISTSVSIKTVGYIEQSLRIWAVIITSLLIIEFILLLYSVFLKFRQNIKKAEASH